MQGIKNIIFDLGGVIINIHPERTFQAFQQYLDTIPDISIYEQELFFDLETGKVDADTFIEKSKEILNIDMPNELILKGLNAMLGDIPAERIELVESLKDKYETFLLSNTNPIHFDSVNEIFQESAQKTFESLFRKTYYSHLIGLRKPDTRIFELVLEENKLQPEETLFLDDTGQNLKGASSLGIHTVKVTKDKDIVHILKDF